MSTTHSVRWMSIGAAVALTACGGGSTSTDGGTTQIQPTFSSIQQNVFAAYGCAAGACHGPPTLAGGLDLTTANAYKSLLGANGMGAPIHDPNMDPGEVQAAMDGYLLVSPGNPSKSFLLAKVTPGLPPKYGLQMPNTGATLSTAQVQAISDWITAGAQNN